MVSGSLDVCRQDQLPMEPARGDRLSVSNANEKLNPCVGHVRWAQNEAIFEPEARIRIRCRGSKHRGANEVSQPMTARSFILALACLIVLQSLAPGQTPASASSANQSAESLGHRREALEQQV